MTLPPYRHGDRKIVPTEAALGVIGRRWTWRGAQRLARQSEPVYPSFHLQIEDRGRLRGFAVVAYHNMVVRK